LMIPMVGFLPAHDPRVRGTIEAIERELVEGGFVLRYRTADTGDVDGLSGREGAFLACSFWLADCLSMLGREHDARQLLDRLMGLRNDLGLLSEEYDPVAGRLVGNFPQAFSHVSLVNSASKIGGDEKPTSNHVIAGLARRALTYGKSRTNSRHMGSFNARSVLTRLVDDSGVGGQVGKAPIAGQSSDSPTATVAPGGVKGSKKPTSAPSVKKAMPLDTTSSARPSDSTTASTGPAAAATKTVPKRAGPAKKQSAEKQPAKKQPAKKETVRRMTARDHRAEQAGKQPAKKQPAKKQPAKAVVRSSTHAAGRSPDPRP
jgi:hypothetical protein